VVQNFIVTLFSRKWPTVMAQLTVINSSITPMRWSLYHSGPIKKKERQLPTKAPAQGALWTAASSATPSPRRPNMPWPWQIGHRRPRSEGDWIERHVWGSLYIYISVCVFNVRYLKTMLLSLFFRGIVLNMCTYIYIVYACVCASMCREKWWEMQHICILDTQRRMVWVFKKIHVQE